MTSLAESNARTLRAIESLTPAFQRQVRGWVTEMINSKIPPLIYCGRRTMEEQAALYKIGGEAGDEVYDLLQGGFRLVPWDHGRHRDRRDQHGRDCTQVRLPVIQNVI